MGFVCCILDLNFETFLFMLCSDCNVCLSNVYDTCYLKTVV